MGSFEREQYRAGGSASSLIQPFLDSRIGQKNSHNGKTIIDLDEAVKIAKDAFHGASERDIYTGDHLQLFIMTLDGIRSDSVELRKD